MRHIVGLAADIICLQEVEDDTFGALEAGLASLGYVGHYTKKGQGKPDGCALFYRQDVFAPLQLIRVDYLDGGEGHGNSGHIAQIALLKHAGRLLGVAHTHLKWDAPRTPREEQYGYRQIRQLLRERDRYAPSGSAWIVCGDLNATPHSPVVAALRAAGLEHTHHACTEAHTCNSNHRAKMIDCIFYNAALRAWPVPLPVVDAHTPLPGPDQPSDHVAVVARFHWVAEPQRQEATADATGGAGGGRMAQGVCAMIVVQAVAGARGRHRTAVRARRRRGSRDMSGEVENLIAKANDLLTKREFIDAARCLQEAAGIPEGAVERAELLERAAAVYEEYGWTEAAARCYLSAAQLLDGERKAACLLRCFRLHIEAIAEYQYDCSWEWRGAWPGEADEHDADHTRQRRWAAVLCYSCDNAW